MTVYIVHNAFSIFIIFLYWPKKRIVLAIYYIGFWYDIHIVLEKVKIVF